MAIKVLKEGAVKAPSLIPETFESDCSKCGAIVSFATHDADRIETAVGAFYAINCPTKGCTNTVSANEGSGKKWQQYDPQD